MVCRAVHQVTRKMVCRAVHRVTRKMVCRAIHQVTGRMVTRPQRSHLASPPSGGLRPIAHWRPFKMRRQASTPGDSADRATDTRYRRLYSHTSDTRTQQFSARCSIYGKASTREDKSSKWLHPASPPIKTMIWWCFAADVDKVMFRGKEKASNRRRTVLS